MSFKLFPSEYCKSTYMIDFEKYYNEGYRGIIFDIDNTLVPHNAMHDERSLELFKKLKELGFKYCFVSNNKEPRVKEFSDPIDGCYVYKAGKPKKDGYLEAMRLMGTKRRNTFFVGDQLFTDIWGANNARLHNILVKQVAFHEEIQIYLKRIIEKPILWIYLIKEKLKNRK
ncbi:MAG: HAD-IIIA family hydrolase [Eubacterium sp.]|nr:HAD-IIIA family hydrolase [Eubacterium sp.]